MPKVHIIPLSFLLFTLSYILIDCSFIYLSEISYNGIVTENAYQKGLNYNRVLQADKKQQNLKWHSKADIQNDKNAILTFRVTKEDNKAVTGGKLTGMLGRPTHNRNDMRFEMSEISPGIYRVLLPPLNSGQWDLRIKMQVNDTEYYHRQRLRLTKTL